MREGRWWVSFPCAKLVCGRELEWWSLGKELSSGAFLRGEETSAEGLLDAEVKAGECSQAYWRRGIAGGASERPQEKEASTCRSHHCSPDFPSGSQTAIHWDSWTISSLGDLGEVPLRSLKLEKQASHSHRLWFKDQQGFWKKSSIHRPSKLYS